MLGRLRIWRTEPSLRELVGAVRGRGGPGRGAGAEDIDRYQKGERAAREMKERGGSITRIPPRPPQQPRFPENRAPCGVHAKWARASSPVAARSDGPASLLSAGDRLSRGRRPPSGRGCLSVVGSAHRSEADSQRSVPG